MSAAMAATGIRTEHDVTMLAMRCRVAVLRNPAGQITGLEVVKADDKRRKLIEAAHRGLANGATVEQGLLNALTFYDLWRSLSALEGGAK